jgi:hypothetical protein
MISRLPSFPFLIAPLSLSLAAAVTACSPNKSPGASGGDTGGGGGSAVPVETQGCGADVKLYATPDDPTEKGPWPVGVKTVYEGGWPTEVFYPAEIGSEAGKDKVTYPLFDVLPASVKGQLAFDSPPIQTGDAYRDLPLDTAHGPYPVILYTEGYYGVKTENLSHITHWASRGFIVFTLDLPGMNMADQLDGTFVYDIAADQKGIMNTIRDPAGPSAFLIGHMDLNHMGSVGRGGGPFDMDKEPGVRVIIGATVKCGDGDAGEGPDVESNLVLASVGDPWYTDTQSCVTALKSTTRLVGLGADFGIVMSDLCFIEDKNGKTFTEAVMPYGKDFPQNRVEDLTCAHGIPEANMKSILDYTTTAVLEEKLTCKSGPDLFDGIQKKYPDIGDFQSKKP